MGTARTETTTAAIKAIASIRWLVRMSGLRLSSRLSHHGMAKVKDSLAEPGGLGVASRGARPSRWAVIPSRAFPKNYFYGPDPDCIERRRLFGRDKSVDDVCDSASAGRKMLNRFMLRAIPTSGTGIYFFLRYGQSCWRLIEKGE